MEYGDWMFCISSAQIHFCAFYSICATKSSKSHRLWFEWKYAMLLCDRSRKKWMKLARGSWMLNDYLIEDRYVNVEDAPYKKSLKYFIQMNRKFDMISLHSICHFPFEFLHHVNSIRLFPLDSLLHTFTYTSAQYRVVWMHFFLVGPYVNVQRLYFIRCLRDYWIVCNEWDWLAAWITWMTVWMSVCLFVCFEFVWFDLGKLMLVLCLVDL